MQEKLLFFSKFTNESKTWIQFIAVRYGPQNPDAVKKYKYSSETEKKY